MRRCDNCGLATDSPFSYANEEQLMCLRCAEATGKVNALVSDGYLLDHILTIKEDTLLTDGAVLRLMYAALDKGKAWLR